LPTMQLSPMAGSLVDAQGVEPL